MGVVLMSENKSFEEMYNSATSLQKEFINAILKGNPVIAAVARKDTFQKPEDVICSVFGSLEQIDLLRCCLNISDIEACGDRVLYQTLVISVVTLLNKGMPADQIQYLINDALKDAVERKEVERKPGDTEKRTLH
jgi:hypothetical protein